ncbi:alanine racemase [Pontixanthobacter aestiaquae]|uniref:alanine racemase n=1 Tax=Pontixanthobacter aestiaquae TaxID=1509367 RepID=A0A844Z8N9_9SPHN|nr:alanine racemase [Pontixanthobacter aestiaquae]MDN3645414.1 alanine racemase [Pontixanthobacter aestiaquae]MXO83586.1 alanine racemase [Pontixanthobacter aestiaquae]
MPDAPPPTLRLRIDTSALASNWRTLDGMSGTAKAGAAVKANCYGLGVEACVPALRDAGAELFFVAHWSEVAAVARHVPPEQIAVLHGPITGDHAAYARSVGVLPVINSVMQARIWSDTGGGPCHLMIDTGINRLGINPHDLAEEAVQVLDVQILMSHLACADEASPMNEKQRAAFTSCHSAIKHSQLSLANSAGVALGSDYHFDVSRPGLSLYGGIPRAELAELIQQVAYPETAIMQVRNLVAGDCVGYNATFTADCDMRVGVVSLGYADGYLRSWAGNGFLTHAGRLLPLLGKVSMDMIVIDLTNAPELLEGDWLEVPYSLPEASQSSGLSQYELLTILGPRFH